MPTFATVILLCKILHVNVYMYTLCDINPKEKRWGLNKKAHILTLFPNFHVSLALFKLTFLLASLQFCQFFLAPGQDAPTCAFACFHRQRSSYLVHPPLKLSCGVCFMMLWKSTSLPFRQSNFVDYFVGWVWWGDERQRAISGHKQSLLQHFAWWAMMDEKGNCTGPKMNLLSSLCWGPDWAQHSHFYLFVCFLTQIYTWSSQGLKCQAAIRGTVCHLLEDKLKHLTQVSNEIFIPFFFFFPPFFPTCQPDMSLWFQYISELGLKEYACPKLSSDKWSSCYEIQIALRVRNSVILGQRSICKSRVFFFLM